MGNKSFQVGKSGINSFPGVERGWGKESFVFRFPLGPNHDRLAFQEVMLGLLCGTKPHWEKKTLISLRCVKGSELEGLRVVVRVEKGY